MRLLWVESRVGKGLEGAPVLVSVGLAFEVKIALELLSADDVIEFCVMSPAELQEHDGGVTGCSVCSGNIRTVTLGNSETSARHPR